MKQGFSLLTAVIFLVVIATLSMLALSLSTQSAKVTTDDYLKTQAELLAKSGTEFALLAMSGHDYTHDGCLNQVNMTYNNQFDINVSIMYIGNGLPSGAATTDCTHILSNSIATSDSNRTVILDTVVSTKAGIATEPIRLHRRTIQKP